MAIEVIKTEEKYKRTDEVLDYDFIFTKFLSNGADSIASCTVTVPGGLSAGTKSNTTTVVKQFLSGGTNGGVYEVLCSITTSSGRTKKLKLILYVID